MKKLGARVAALEDQLVPPLSQAEKAREIGELKMRQADATRQLEEMTNEVHPLQPRTTRHSCSPSTLQP